MTGSSLFTNFARVAKVVALLLFLLPWVAVSCSPEAMERLQESARESAPASARPPSLGATPAVTIARASGLNMAMGSLQMVTPAGMGPPAASPAPGADRVPEVAPEIGVIAGAALLLLGLALTFLKGSAGTIASAGCSLLALIAFCYSVFVHYPPAVIAAFAAGRQGGSNASADQIGQILSVQPETGFYIVLLLLVLAIVFNILAMKKSGAAPAPATAAAPPPAEPPAAV